MKLLQGNCLKMLDAVQNGVADMVLTDPPYSSGGIFPGDRKKSTREKYTDERHNGAARLPDFSGDNMDQRSFEKFMSVALTEAREKTKPGGICAAFIDWRGLPLMADALQMAGWIYRGVVVWDKGNSRAIPGRYRNDCEYIVWGTNGRRPARYAPGASVFKGCHHLPGVLGKNKRHQTEKPVELLKELLKIVPPGGAVLDPFMGSGSTGEACAELGLDFIGIELSGFYFDVAKRRIEQAYQSQHNGAKAL